MIKVVWNIWLISSGQKVLCVKNVIMINIAKEKLEQTRQCTSCGYQATPTSGTLFHKVKFPLLKAFYILYFMSTNKKGISSTELSRKLNLRQKTCWLFRKKVVQSMKSSKQYPLTGSVEIDEMVVGQQEENVVGRR